MSMTNKTNRHYDAIVIGGGATGAGTARDCAMRGLRTLLIEKFDFTQARQGEITDCCIAEPDMP